MKKLFSFFAMCAMGLTAFALNPFAYNISATGIPEGGVLGEETTELQVSYTLNAPAVSVGIVFMDGENELSRVAFTGEGLNTAGDHSTTVSLEGLPAGKTITWKIYAEGEALTAPAAIQRAKDESGNEIKVWGPYAMAVDNNPQSAHFGRILYTETHAGVLQDGTLTTKNYVGQYLSTGSNGTGAGLGVYELDPQLHPVKNSTGGYGYNGGIIWTQKKYTEYKTQYGLTVTPYDDYLYGPKRIAISKDGRIFLSVADLDNCPVYELNPNDLNSWTPLFQGSYKAMAYQKGVDGDGQPVMQTGVFYVNENDQILATAAHGMDVYGEGENLKLAIHTHDLGLAFDNSRAHTYEYNLGTATSVAQPGANVEAIEGKYTQNPQYANVAYGEDGSLWYIQYRGSVHPIIAHVSADGTKVDEVMPEGDFNCRGAGIAFSPDYSMLAIATGTKAIGVYKLEEIAPAPADGAPLRAAASGPETMTFATTGVKLTRVYSITNNGFNGNNALAFDLANNLYTCTNNAERLGVHALPRENNVCDIPARDEFAFQLPAESENELYIAGSFTNWAQDKLKMNVDEETGNYTITIEGVENGALFKFIDQDNVWYGGNVGDSGDTEYGVHKDWCTDIQMISGDDGKNFKVTTEDGATRDLTFIVTPNFGLTITGWEVPAPEVKVYAIQNDAEGNWNLSTGTELVKDEADGHYRGMVTLVALVEAGDAPMRNTGEGKAFLGFTTKLGEDWNDIADGRFGPVSNGNYVMDDSQYGNEISLTDVGQPAEVFEMPAGKYNLDVDLDGKKIVLTQAEPSTGVKEVNGVKEIVRVKYVNMAGVQADEPFDGVNVKVITYKDGTTKAVKVIK